MNQKLYFLIFLVCFVAYVNQSAAGGSYSVLEPQQYREHLNRNTAKVLESTDEESALESRRKEFEEKGYHDTYSNSAAMLIHIKEQIAEEKTTKKHDEDPTYTGRRDDISKIPLSFPYSGLTLMKSSSIIGYGAAGGFEDEKWTGVVSYFDHADFGTCRITILDLGSGGKSVYDKSKTTYEINNKPTTYYAEGNDDSGFFYAISWTGNRYEKILDCANSNSFDSETMRQIIAFAKIIDEDPFDPP